VTSVFEGYLRLVKGVDLFLYARLVVKSTKRGQLQKQQQGKEVHIFNQTCDF